MRADITRYFLALMPPNQSCKWGCKWDGHHSTRKKLYNHFNNSKGKL